MDLILCMLLVLLGRFSITSILVDADTRSSENTKTNIVTNVKTTSGESWGPKLTKKEHITVHNDPTNCNTHNNSKTSVNDVTSKFKRDTNKFLFKTYSEENQFKYKLNSHNEPEEQSQFIKLKKPTITKIKMRQRRNPQIAPRPIVINPLMPNPLQPVLLPPPPMPIPPMYNTPVLPPLNVNSSNGVPKPLMPPQGFFVPNPMVQGDPLPNKQMLLNVNSPNLRTNLVNPNLPIQGFPNIISPVHPVSNTISSNAGISTYPLPISAGPVLSVNVNSSNGVPKPLMPSQGFSVPNPMLQGIPLPNKQNQLNVNSPNLRTNLVNPNFSIQGFPNIISPTHPVSNTISFNGGISISTTTSNPTMQKLLLSTTPRPKISNSAMFPISNTISSNTGVSTYPLPISSTTVLSNTNASGCLTFYAPLLLTCIFIIRSF